MKSKNNQPPTILSGTEKNGMSHFWKVFICGNCCKKENNAFKKTWMQVRNSLERNLRSINVLFSEKKQKKKKKMPALKLNQLLAKWNFSDDRNIYFMKKRAQLSLTLKLLFQNFLPWLYHIHCIMRTCKLRGTFINNVLYFSISQKLIMQLNVKMQTPSSSEQF